jgi:2-dehydropantoate 2-reductase
MKIAVMATGGVGGYFGARLHASGEDVHFIARGPHLRAIQQHGLDLLSAGGDINLKVPATDDPATIGPVDVVLFAVKLWDLESAAAACRPLIGPETAFIPLVNGVDAEERLVPIIGRQHVLGGVAYISAAIASQGVIEQTGTMARLVFGEYDGRSSDRAVAFETAGKRAGYESVLSGDIRLDIWTKMAVLASFSGVACVSRQPMGPVRGESLTRGLLRSAMAEVVAVAAEHDVELGADFVDRQLGLIESMPAEMKASMLVDLERGNRLELDWLSGAVARLGDAKGVPTPVHHFIEAALTLHKMGAR